MTGTMRGRKERKKRKGKVNGQQFTLMQCPHTNTANESQSCRKHYEYVIFEELLLLVT